MKGFLSKCTVLKVYHLWACMCAVFSQQILQSEAVNGLNFKNFAVRHVFVVWMCVQNDIKISCTVPEKLKFILLASWIFPSILCLHAPVFQCQTACLNSSPQPHNYVKELTLFEKEQLFSPFFNTPLILCGQSGPPYLGKATVAAKAALLVPSNTCSISVCPNNSGAASVWDF